VVDCLNFDILIAIPFLLMLYGTNMKGRGAICKSYKLLVALMSIIFSCISLSAFGKGILFCFQMPYGTSGRTVLSTNALSLILKNSAKYGLEAGRSL